MSFSFAGIAFALLSLSKNQVAIKNFSSPPHNNSDSTKRLIVKIIFDMNCGVADTIRSPKAQTSRFMPSKLVTNIPDSAITKGLS